ncbi:DinB family protein [Phyllobacterium sp. CL33Tsu]|uniref:DinB family protein n=1 Tax=Phyllobacterium sp. CL33Tsu TaxID=1798191 RepID=UPI000A6F2497|nr:DinB family protein [Phyllobacterium sp. CL33Tsu]
MSSQVLLKSLFEYKAWANDTLYRAMLEIGDENSPSYRTALSTLNHAHIVDRIFMAHLKGRSHSYSTNEPDGVPAADRLFSDVRETDAWYIGYMRNVTSAELSEIVAFQFTDGKPGRMSREEMLAHVITHGS